jgi:hypothetical protein
MLVLEILQRWFLRVVLPILDLDACLAQAVMGSQDLFAKVVVFIFASNRAIGCPDPGLNWFFIAACLVVILVVLVFLVIQGKTSKNKEAVSSKILLNHIQMLALLSSVATAWLDPFQTLLSIGGVATLMDSRIVLIDCVFTVGYYYQFAFYLLVPFATVIGSAIVHLIYFLFKVGILYYIVSEPSKLFYEIQFNLLTAPRGETRKQLTSQYVLSITVITFITYPAICMKVMEIFDCTVHVEDKSYLNIDPYVPMLLLSNIFSEPRNATLQITISGLSLGM